MAYLDKTEGSEALVKFEYGDKLQHVPDIWEKRRQQQQNMRPVKEE